MERKWWRESGLVLVGSVLFGVGVNLFLVPGGIVFGGFTGIATLLHRLWGVPTGLVIVALNIPLLLWGWKQLGWRRLARTPIGILATSVATDALAAIPQVVTDPMLCALYGGIALGAGVGLLLREGYTTGGTDLIATLVGGRVPLTTGKLILLMDGLVIGSSALVLGEIEAAFYAILSGIACTWVLELVLFGADRARQAIIISAQPDALAHALMTELQRGVTVLHGEGAYTGTPKRVLLCVVRPAQVHRLRAIVEQHDAGAILLFCDVTANKRLWQ